MALAGGVTVMATPGRSWSFPGSGGCPPMGGVSRSPRLRMARVFEGAGLVLVERLV